MGEICLRGYPICGGIAIGTPFVFSHAEERVTEFAVDNVDHEVERYYDALKSSRKDLLSMQRRLKKEGGSEAVDILRAHLEITHDPLMTRKVESEIRRKGMNTESVFTTVIGEYQERFSKISDSFFQERIQDFQDISRRIIRYLNKSEEKNLSHLEQPVIVFAHELLPSDTAESKGECIEAFVTRSGSETSHVAIVARARGIPFVSKVDFPSLENESCVIVDGESGAVVINPSQETLGYYKKEQKKLQKAQRGLRKCCDFDAKTLDGEQLLLSANVEMFDELEELDKYCAKGVGLFRSEYLFLAKDGFPSEEEQFQLYRKVVEKVGDDHAVIRTFDIGGDKLGDLYPTRMEKNPFLGCRAIRLMLKEKTAFLKQLRAMLRASAFGNLSILFPMISGLVELREAKELVEEAKEELRSRGIPFNENVPIGCMIEVPSAAFTADLLLQECDFLSIGTNDLVQYSLAVERGNPGMDYLYTAAHPCIIRMIRHVVEEGKKAGKPVAVCGEVAADPRYTALLLGLGVRELSLSMPAMPQINEVIRRISIDEAQHFADWVMTLSTYIEVEEALEEAYDKIL
ncbi:MAG: Phosphoenolpyruvate-protein phosphotransferase [Chlamydiales bacterium]|nr:Phosphoenolpyruvate-protein phosphotransferase [Chlamydiales bacterium]MCH9635465.1 Phosphoenolpyruvate-protein phosphotransferase [Chlamydiales bacterium]